MLVKDWLSVFRSDRYIRVVTENISSTLTLNDTLTNYRDFELKSAKQDISTGQIILYVSESVTCPHYRTRTVKRYLTEYEKGYYAALHNDDYVDFIDEEESYCFGTKNREVCHCDGNKEKCEHRGK